MSDHLYYRRKAEALLRQAAAAENMAERGRLIDEAMYWHMLALDSGDGGTTDEGRDEDDTRDRTRPA